jgi:alpha-galactosidase
MFRFSYEGKDFSGDPLENQVIKPDANLEVRVVSKAYPESGAFEYTVWFENVGTSNTGVINNVIAADMVFEGENPVLKGVSGDLGDHYTPYEKELANERVNFKVEGGRPTHKHFPYFNLEHSDRGTFLAIGWGGTWEADFYLDEQGKARFLGQGNVGVKGNYLSTYLKPGEKIRTPLILTLPYDKRDEAYATNVWRRWFLQNNIPKANAQGDPIKPFSTAFFAFDTGLPNSDGSISERYHTWKPSFDKMLERGIKTDFRWVDAGWYCDANGQTVESDWYGTVGTWTFDEEKWPGDTFKDSVDYCNAKGIKTLLWFEPERITYLKSLVKNYGYKEEWALFREGNESNRANSNNIGNEECLEWTKNQIMKTLKRGNLDLYREDNNLDPACNWNAGDLREGDVRVGITENKCVQGHYKLWDAIIAFCMANGKCTFVDVCASGGGRNDLESLRRGIPFMRSDADRTTTALRLAMTTSFDRWIPFCGNIAVEQAEQLTFDQHVDTYVLRASYGPVINLGFQYVQRPELDSEIVRKGLVEWDTVKDYFLKDFYVLTPWNAHEETTHWTSYMFFDSEKGEGAVFAFRMERTEDESIVLQLKGLEPMKNYELIDADRGTLGIKSGGEWSRGLNVKREQKRTAVLIYIKEVNG